MVVKCWLKHNSVPRPDDLVENAIMVVDGGDGIMNGSDYILFYANGPDEWVKDSLTSGFHIGKMFSADKSYYFLVLEEMARESWMHHLFSSPNISVTTFSERYFHELDTVNFLGSRKEWYGEEFSDLPGRSLTRTFNVSIPNIQTNSPLILQTNCAARSVGVGSRFDVGVNNQQPLN